MWRPAKKSPVSKAGVAVPFHQRCMTLCWVLAFWQQDRLAGVGGWKKEGSQVVKIVGTTSTAFGIRKINISTITTDNTNINNNNSKHLCKASCSSGTVLNILSKSTHLIFTETQWDGLLPLFYRGGKLRHRQIKEFTQGNKGTRWQKWESHLGSLVPRLSFLTTLASLMAQTQVQSLGQEDPLEKGTATHSSILAWRIPWTKETGGLQSMGSKELDMTEN